MHGNMSNDGPQSLRCRRHVRIQGRRRVIAGQCTCVPSGQKSSGSEVKGKWFGNIGSGV